MVVRLDPGDRESRGDYVCKAPGCGWKGVDVVFMTAYNHLKRKHHSSAPIVRFPEEKRKQRKRLSVEEVVSKSRGSYEKTKRRRWEGMYFANCLLPGIMTLPGSYKTDDKDAFYFGAAPGAPTPVMVSTGIAFPLKISVSPGSGELRCLAGIGAKGVDSFRVAMAWASLNVSSIWKAIKGGKNCPATLYSRNEDVTLVSTQPECPRDGYSAGACFALAAAGWLTQAEFQHEWVGVTGNLDLRGRLLGVGGLEVKAKCAMEQGVSILVVPSCNYDDLMANDFSEIADGARDYARANFRRATTMTEVLELALKGESYQAHSGYIRRPFLDPVPQ